MHMNTQPPSDAKRRPVNLTIREDIVKAARALKLNTSKAAENGILAAIRQAEADHWRKKNRRALEAHNTRVEKDGAALLRPSWSKE